MTEPVPISEEPGSLAEDPNPQTLTTPARTHWALFPAVALVCSAGGLEALSTVLGGLPRDFPAAVIALQHLSPATPSPLADILRSRTALPVARLSDTEQLRPGRVFVVPEAKHAIIDSRACVRLLDSDHAPRPSADLLLCTLAVSLGPRVVAVVMSGGGDDGATGCQAVRVCGGQTIIEDPATAQLGAMPRAALLQGDPSASLSLSEISGALIDLVAEMSPLAG